MSLLYVCALLLSFLSNLFAGTFSNLWMALNMEEYCVSSLVFACTVCRKLITLLFLLNKHTQLASVDLVSIVGAGGRPRDMYNYHWPGDEMNSYIRVMEAQNLVLYIYKGRYGVLAVITSLGKMMMLSVSELVKSSDDSALQSALLCSHQIKGEPRLIAIAVWDTSNGSRPGYHRRKRRKKIGRQF